MKMETTGECKAVDSQRSSIDGLKGDEKEMANQTKTLEMMVEPTESYCRSWNLGFGSNITIDMIVTATSVIKGA